MASRTNNVLIHNVSKSLVKDFGSDRLLSFKYPESASGYASVILGKDNIYDSSNEKMCNVKVSRFDKYDMLYEKADKDGGENIKCSKKVSGMNIKDYFDASRNKKPEKQNQSRAGIPSQNREQTSRQNTFDDDDFIF